MDRQYVARKTGRAVPSTSVTVALLEENVPVAYGIVRDLSDIGACIMTDTVLKPGSSYQFRMSFFGGQVLEATARIVWNESPGAGMARMSEVPHGLQFVDINGGHRDNLRRILETSAFGAQPTC